MLETSPEDVNSVLQAFQPILRSIDMRTIAIKPEIDTDWENLITSIIVSEKTVEEVTAEHEKLPKLKNKQIALFLFAAPFDYSIFEQFTSGSVVDNRLIITKGGMSNRKLTIRSRRFNPLILKMKSIHTNFQGIYKYVLRVADSGSAEERELLWKIAQRQDNEAKRLGYSNIMALIKDALKIELSGSDRKDFELTISTCRLN